MDSQTDRPLSAPADVQAAIAELRSQYRRLRQFVLATFVGVIALGAWMLAQRVGDQQLMRTRGIVLEDEAGRDRILIGAPVPPSADRVRTDVARAQQAWGARLGGDKFPENYARLDHGANGIVFLNDQGFDRLVLGDKTPDPNSGKRMVDPTGLTWNDEQGYELGGIGCSKTAEGKYHVVMGMDDPTVGEALHLFVLEDGSKGLRIAAEDSLLLLGRAKAGNEIFGNSEEFAGLMVKDKQGKVVLESNAFGH